MNDVRHEPETPSPEPMEPVELTFEFDEDNTLRTVPRELTLMQGQTLVITHEGRQPGILFVPEDSIFGGHMFWTKGEDRFTLQLDVREDSALGSFPYSVYLKDHNQIAEGFSPPRMIIDPPER